MRTLALSESSRDDVISTIKDFLNPKAYYQVMRSLSTPSVHPTIQRLWSSGSNLPPDIYMTRESRTGADPLI